MNKIIQQFGKFIIIKDIVNYTIQIKSPTGQIKVVAANLPLKNATIIAQALHQFKAEFNDFQ